MNTLRKTTIVRATVVLLFLAAASLLLGVLSMPTGAAPTAEVVNVLAIGDSITYGYYNVRLEPTQPAGLPTRSGNYPMAYGGKSNKDDTRASYRLPLFQLLAGQNQYAFQFVGNVYADKPLPDGKTYNKFAGYPAIDGDPVYPKPPTPYSQSLAFVGWPNKTSADINSTDDKWGLSLALEGLTETQKPDVALIHLGTNDINKSLTDDQSKEALRGILVSLQTKNPEMVVYLAAIIPAAYPGPNCDDDPLTTPAPTNPFTTAGIRTFAANCSEFAYEMGTNEPPVPGTEPPVEKFNRLLLDFCQPISVPGVTGTNTRRCTFAGIAQEYADLKNMTVYLVDQWAGFDAENWLVRSDEVHPTRHGECRIALRWYEALRETGYALPEVSPSFCDEYHESYEDNMPPLPDSQIKLLSRHSSGVLGNGTASSPSASDDGRYVAFASSASNLVPFDTRRCQRGDDDVNCSDVFVHDRATGRTSRVSIRSDGGEGNGHSVSPDISGDGRNVTFWSDASNLVDNDTNNTNDVFVHDRQTGITTRVSVNSSGQEGNSISWAPSISADGRYVLFESLANNLAGVPDTNGEWDVFRHDRLTGATIRVSVDSAGIEGNDGSAVADISADGRYVLFASTASNLVSGDTNKDTDIFIHDTQTGQTTRVSVGSGEYPVEANSGSYNPSMSADSRFIVFESYSSNLGDNDTNGVYDIYVHDRQLKQTARASVSSFAGYAEADDESLWPVVSDDGRYVAFTSIASNLDSDDTQQCTDYYEVWNCEDVFVRDMLTGETSRISNDPTGQQGDKGSSVGDISADGRFVFISSGASNLVPRDTNGMYDVFVYDQLWGEFPPTATPAPGTPTPTATPTASVTPTPTSTPTVSPTPDVPAYKLFLPVISATAGG